MKLIVYVIGAPLAVICLLLFGALRLLAWLMALACGLCLILALFTIGHPAAMWRALEYAGLLFAGSAMLRYGFMLFSRVVVPGPARA